MSYYSYEHYFHIEIEAYSTQEAQKVCSKLIESGISFTVSNKYDDYGASYLIKVETISGTTIQIIEQIMQSLNIDIVI